MTAKATMATLLAAAVIVACGGSSSSSSGQAGAGSQTVWKNGTSGPFFGDTPSVSGVNGAAVAVVPTTDPLSGDSQALQVSNPYFGGVKFLTVSPHDASSYAAGHVQFDMRLDTAITGNVILWWGVQSQSENSVALSHSGFPVGSFVHVSEPVSAFNGGSSQNLSLLIEPLSVQVSGGSATGPLFTIANVRWTAD